MAKRKKAKRVKAKRLKAKRVEPRRLREGQNELAEGAGGQEGH
jgi:hypothetical protein